ncbi:hypothetical protein WISP_56264 [Willisornis vidua]|uniref:Uncharacterized protein n=1 Tax=Willisornis vidua TaxID=1566151 RepID=A0ABQ9DHQ8_9PASS|nr:hypothetical protein WISP_56264 [Willisornis vidua]
MSKMMKKIRNIQPAKALLNWQRKDKVKAGVAESCLGVRAGLVGRGRADVPWQQSQSLTTFSSSSSEMEDNRQSQAAGQAEENCSSSPALSEQVPPAGPEGQAAAPPRPRGCGRAVLHTLRRMARVTVSSIAVVIRRRGQQAEEQRDVEQGTETARAETSRAAGAEIQAAAPHSLCCHHSPSPSQLEDLSEQWAEFLPVKKEETCSEDKSLWDATSLPELSQGQENGHQSLFPVEHSNGQELSQDKKKTKVHTIWVKPYPKPLLLEPEPGSQEGPKCACSMCREAAEEAVAELHSTARVLRAPRDTQTAAGALATAPEEEEQHKPFTAETRDMAKSAASPALGEQVTPAGPEGQAAAPHRPRGRSRAALHPLRRWARATRRSIADVIRRRGQQVEGLRDVEEGMEAARAATARAAGAQSQAAAPHRPSCYHSPTTSQLEALSGHWTGAFPPVTETCSEDESLWDVSSLLAPSQEEESTQESWSTGGESSSLDYPSSPYTDDDRELFETTSSSSSLSTCG